MELLLGAGRSWKDVDKGGLDDLTRMMIRMMQKRKKHGEPKLRNAKDI